MHGDRETVASADGATIALTTHGSGPPLLLVHGGMCTAERWTPLWPLLTPLFTVTAMDRRGRATTTEPEATRYTLEAEYQDLAAVCALLASRHRSPVDVFAHSYGAVCALGAAAAGAPIRRLVLYEPPGPQTLPTQWLDRARAMVTERQFGPALVSFLIDIVGLTSTSVQALRDAPRTFDPLPVVARTMLREAEALTAVDLRQLAELVHQPVHLLLGTTSPPWAHEVTTTLAHRLINATTVTLTGHGHDAVDINPQLIAHLLREALPHP